MAPNLPSSDFFDLPPRDQWGAPPKFYFTSEDVERLVNVPVRPGGAGAGGVCSSAETTPPPPPPLGLSNGPYWAVTPSQLFELTIRPASALVRLRQTRRLGEYDIGSHRRSDKRAPKRGSIREFSRRSRLNLRLKAADLQVLVGAPDLMITLTYPADWRSVCLPCCCGAEVPGATFTNCTCELDYPERKVSGEIVKDKHLKAFRKRLERYFKRLGVPRKEWGALWFFEFQTRGAPHVHLMLWRLSGLDLAPLREFVSTSWAEVVNHPDPEEFSKHLKAGTRVELARAKHFGYACKYASKMIQKSVPDGWESVGRFWGVWNDPCGAPLLRAFHPAANTFRKLSDGLSAALVEHSPSFASGLHDLFTKVKTFSVRVFGRAASEFLCCYGSSPQSQNQIFSQNQIRI